MHFLVLTQYYEPEVGAAQSRLSALARGLLAAGNEVTVVTALPNYPTGRIMRGYRHKLFAVEWIDGVRIIRTPLYPATGRGIQRMVNYTTFTLSATVGMFAAGRPSHLFVESPPLTLAIPGLLVGRLWGAQVVFNVADPWPDVAVEIGALQPGRTVDALLALESWAYRHAHLITSPTEGVMARLRTTKQVPESKTLLLPNGADTSRFSPDRGNPKILDELSLPMNRLFIYAGTMGYLHGLHNVVTAAALAAPRGVHLALVGGGSEKLELIRHARSLGASNVSFHEPIEPSRLAGLLPLAKAGVVSLADIPANEVVRSAKMFPVMASGRPLLHIGLGEGARLVESSGAGLVVPNRDPNEIAAAMGEMVSMPPSTLQDMGDAGREFVLDNLSWDSIVRSLISRLSDPEASE